MTLYDLKNTLDMCVDFYDDEIDGSVFFELADIPDAVAKKITVTAIRPDMIVCRFTEYLRHQKNRICKYLRENFADEPEIAQFYRAYLVDYDDDITDDGGEGVYAFIKNELEYFLMY